MSLNDSLSEVERAKLAVWDYPVSDKYTKMWQAMKEAGLPNTLEEAVERVRKSRSSSEGFAFLGTPLTLNTWNTQIVIYKVLARSFHVNRMLLPCNRGRH